MKARRALLALLGSTLVCVVAVESGLRLAWQNPYRGETDRVLLLRTHYAHKHRVYGRAEIDPDGALIALETDARGYLLPSTTHPDPDLTIAFLGGSTTECTAVRPEQRFPARVASRLEEIGIRANVLNAALSGNNLHDSLNVFLNHVVQDRPDFAVVMHAANDIGVLEMRGGYAHASGAPLSRSHLARWLKQAASRHLWLVGFVRHRLAGVAFRPRQLERGVIERDRPARADRIPIDAFRMRLRAFVDLARAFEVQPVLMTQPLTVHDNELTPSWADRGAQQRFNDTIREVAREKRALLVDLDGYLREEVAGWDDPMRFFYDGMHVTDAGSELYAQHIVDVLLPSLRSRVEQRRAASTRSALGNDRGGG